jgi:hypothetical protein
MNEWGKETRIAMMLCGCEIVIVHLEDKFILDIKYCKRHKAAPELLEACKAYVDWHDDDLSISRLSEILDMQRKAVAKAEESEL